MMMFLTQLVLFFTAVTAGRKCTTRGYRTHGLVAFVVLEIGYLLIWFHAWIAAAILMCVGTWIVLHCINRPPRNALPEKIDGAA